MSARRCWNRRKAAERYYSAQIWARYSTARFAARASPEAQSASANWFRPAGLVRLAPLGSGRLTERRSQATRIRANPYCRRIG
jgi:hypothetical protein